MYDADAEWPRFGDLHRHLGKELDGELGEVVATLVRKLGGKPTLHEWSDEVRIPTRGILLNPRIEETYAVLMRALPLLSEYYLSSTDKPRINHEYFLARGWSKADVARLYNLMRYQAFQGGGGSTPEAGTWNMDLTPAVVRYARAKSARELWTWRLHDDRRGERRLRLRGARGRPNYSAPVLERHWFDQFLLPLVLGVTAAVIAGAILWRLGFAG